MVICTHLEQPLSLFIVVLNRMSIYHVTIEGRNFLVEFNNRLCKHGFFTFRILERIDSQVAELDAIELVRQSKILREIVRNAKDDRPIMEVTEIVELTAEEAAKEAEPGFLWYEEEPKPDSKKRR